LLEKAFWESACSTKELYDTRHESPTFQVGGKDNSDRGVANPIAIGAEHGVRGHLVAKGGVLQDDEFERLGIEGGRSALCQAEEVVEDGP
jgi:hypothetical protein